MGPRSRKPASSSTRVPHHHHRHHLFLRFRRDDVGYNAVDPSSPPPGHLLQGRPLFFFGRLAIGPGTPRLASPTPRFPHHHHHRTRDPHVLIQVVVLLLLLPTRLARCIVDSPALFRCATPLLLLVLSFSFLLSFTPTRTRETLPSDMPGCGPLFALICVYAYAILLGLFSWDSNPHRLRFFSPPPTLFYCMDSGCCACISYIDHYCTIPTL